MFDEHPNLAECFSLLGETSRLVNRNLRDPVKAISDINVAAVTALAFFEVVTSPSARFLSLSRFETE